MSPTWNASPPPSDIALTAADWGRVIWRGGLLGSVVFGGLALMLLLRLVERPLFGVRRPVTPWITQGVCRSAFVILRLPLHRRGPRMKGPGAVVANHASWLDIFALNARKNVYFVSKSEVAGWPGIGWLARATGTLFIKRDRREAPLQTAILKERLMQGHRLLFFPEGTSTDGQQVLPFKSTLFGAFFENDMKHDLQVQPVSVVYHAPSGHDPRFYGWWGDMDFGSHLLRVLAVRRQGSVELIYGEPVRIDNFPNRKTLAQYLESEVRHHHAAHLAPTRKDR